MLLLLLLINPLLLLLILMVLAGADPELQGQPIRKQSIVDPDHFLLLLLLLPLQSASIAADRSTAVIAVVAPANQDIDHEFFVVDFLYY